MCKFLARIMPLTSVIVSGRGNRIVSQSGNRWVIVRLWHGEGAAAQAHRAACSGFPHAFPVEYTERRAAMRILLIEDDEVIAERVKNGLEREGYGVDVEFDGVAGFERALQGVHGIILLDVMLPRLAGWEVCRKLRASGITTPVLMLTARDMIEDRVEGLDAGADDYLPKPFDFRELLARIRALVRRTAAIKSSRILIADLEIDTLARTVRRAGQDIQLTPHQYSLLEALARNAGRTLTRDLILDSVWGDEDRISNTVEFHVAALRKKLDAPFPKKLIHTVHGVGYVLRSPNSDAEP